jgi:fructokinase
MPTTNQPEVICLGELLIDMVSSKKNVGLYDAPAFEPNPGGAPANVVVGVSRLGKRSAFVGKVGRDDFGRGLRQALMAENVDVTDLHEDPETLTTLALVSHSETGDPAFAFFVGAHTRLAPSDLDLGRIAGAQIFHFGSVSLAHQPAQSATLAAFAAAKAAGVICSYDMNWRPLLWASTAVGTNPEQAIAPMADVDILKLNEVELALATGIAEPEAALRALPSPAYLVVVTLGAKGCLYRVGGVGGLIAAQSAPPVANVVDATGAGDTFMAAILAGLRFPLLANDSRYLERLTLRACHAGGIATQKRGAIPAMPSKAELDKICPL